MRVVLGHAVVEGKLLPVLVAEEHRDCETVTETDWRTVTTVRVALDDLLGLADVETDWRAVTIVGD